MLSVIGKRERTCSWLDFSNRLAQMRFSVFPKRFRGNAEWWRLHHWMKKYHSLLEDGDSLFEIRQVPNMGLGVFARRKIRKGTTAMFGSLHRLSHASARKLDEAGETSLVQMRKRVLGKRKKSKSFKKKRQEEEVIDNTNDGESSTGLIEQNQGKVRQKRRKRAERIEWYYLGGPASLLNHSCKRFNAEYAFDERGDEGEFLVNTLCDVDAEQELLVDYGEDFWTQSNIKCQCHDCEN
jgi:SET domain-containing protein